MRLPSFLVCARIAQVRRWMLDAALVVAEGERQAARPLRDVADLPSADDQIFSVVGAGHILLTLAEGKS